NERRRWLLSRCLGLWSADLDGDGKDTLIFLSDGKVVAYSGKLEKPRWEWPVPDPLTGILDIVPAKSGQPGIVFVQAQGVGYGLDGVTGQLRWKCEGPGHAVAVVSGSPPHPRPLSQRERGDNWPPQIWFQELEPAMTVCRLALPVDKEGKYTA